MHLNSHWYSWLGLLVALCMTAACSPMAVSNTPTPTIIIPTLQPTSTPTASPTLTETPTLTASPVPTETPVDEQDLQPAYTESVSQEFKGVQINADLVTDEFLDPVIKKVEVLPQTYAEFIARTVFKVWWNRNRQGTVATEDDFKVYMRDWSVAQKNTGPTQAQALWEKVQLTNIWANDLNDGNGYVQQPYTFWLMYAGEASEGIKKISKFSVVLVGEEIIFTPSTSSDQREYQRCQTNIDGKTR